MNGGSMPEPFFDQNMSAFHTRAGVAAAVLPQNNVWAAVLPQNNV